jgi:hypothetical protein
MGKCHVSAPQTEYQKKEVWHWMSPMCQINYFPDPNISQKLVTTIIRQKRPPGLHICEPDELRILRWSAVPDMNSFSLHMMMQITNYTNKA